MSIQSKIFRLASFSLIALLVVSCSKDNTTNPNSTGTVSFEMTDSPPDDANIQGVFVTVAAIKVDGKAIDGFSKTTIDLTAYQRGDTKVLGSTTLNANTYSNVI